MPPAADPALVAILTAINAGRAEAAEQQHRNDARMDKLESTLNSTVAQLNTHITSEEGTLTGISTMLSEHIAASAVWRAKSDAEMAANTAVTQDVKDGQNFVRTATTVVKWIGAVVFALGSIWWGVRTIMGNSDITPGP